MCSADVFAGDYECYGKKSTTNHFSCLSCGNCVWWAAFKRPDLAQMITGSGWSGGQWYSKFKKLGVSVGLVPLVGDIVEFSDPGHVAYVTSVHDDGSFDVSEMDATCSMGSGILYATYSPLSWDLYTRNGLGTWKLNGFIHFKEETNKIPYIGISEGDVSIYWHPTDVSCINAEKWEYSNGSGYFSVGHNGICYSTFNDLKNIRPYKYVDLEDWHHTFFGNDSEYASAQNCSAN